MFQCYTQTPIALYGVSILVLVVMFVYLLRFGTQSPTIGWFRTFLVTSMGYNLAAATLKCAQPGAAYTYIVDFYGLMATMMTPNFCRIPDSTRLFPTIADAAGTFTCSIDSSR